MRTLFAQLLRDDRGFVVSSELILVATIAVIGCLVGLAAYRDSITQELGDAAAAVGALNQSYSENYSGGGITQAGNGVVTIERTYGTGPNTLTVTATFNASSYTDQADVCETTTQNPGDSPAGITIGTAPVAESP